MGYFTSRALRLARSSVGLNDAIVLFLKHFPGKNDDEFLAVVEDEAIRGAVRSILDETQSIRIEWGQKTLTELGREAREVMHQRHPELSDAALESLGNYFTYLVK